LSRLDVSARDAPPFRPGRGHGEVLPLIAKLSREEWHRLLRLAFRQDSTDADAYAAQPVTPDEFGSDDDALAWEPEGWEGIG
jgi:hypothetical protein